VDDSSGCIIRCFSLYVNWYDNPSCLILIGGYKGTDLHQLLIEVILLLLYYCTFSLATVFPLL
jgi:hypothetical protein